MRKAIPYIIASLLVAALVIMIVTGSNSKKKKLDERVTLRRKDKIPYGTWVAFQGLPKLFPGAFVYATRKEPGSWDAVEEDDSNQLFISINVQFMADEYELDRLLEFVEKGNDVFISTMRVSSEVSDRLQCSLNNRYAYSFRDTNEERIVGSHDSLVVRLTSPPFVIAETYSYPGKAFDETFGRVHSPTTDELGTGRSGNTNFIHLRAGKGNFYLHLAPMAFSNYFLLHKNNLRYYEKALSVVDPNVKNIIWDEYYIARRNNERRQNSKSWISVLFQYPALKAALLTAFFAMLLYLLLGMRRRQRYIPKVSRPRNDSLEFVKTIGRLYYEKNDHKNLCRKMSTYFLEHVRSKYKLTTGTLDESFVKALQFKSGVPEEEIASIVSFINRIDAVEELSPADVSNFHRQLEKFYSKG